MACPYFVPVRKWEGGGWLHPSRLPLGMGWMGLCSAGSELVQPCEQDVREACNLGYATWCGRLPKERTVDAVRFAVIKDAAAIVTLCYVCEAGHRPVHCGTLEWSVSEGKWMAEEGDGSVRKLAECYLESYWAKRGRGQ